MELTGAAGDVAPSAPTRRGAWRLAAAGLLAAGCLIAQAGPDTASGRTPGQPPGDRPPRPVPENWGTTFPSYFSIDASALTPVDTTVQYGCTHNCQLRYVSNGTGWLLAAPIHLPGGALVQYLELDYYDASPAGEVKAVFADCDYEGETCQFLAATCPEPGTTLCSGVAAAGGFGSVNAIVAGDGIRIDNHNHRYFFLVGNTSLDGSTAFSLISVGYVLEVSPPPPAATFGDVPTGHPFFQFVEALAASGITGGCGGGNYCPNSPVTRGQMAVFLAKALGLHWN